MVRGFHGLICTLCARIAASRRAPKFVAFVQRSNPMPGLVIENLPEAIRNTKQQLRAALPEYKEVFRDVEAEMQGRVEEIVAERESGHDVIPVVQYARYRFGKGPGGTDCEGPVPRSVRGARHFQQRKSPSAGMMRLGRMSKETIWTQSLRIAPRTSTLARWPRPSLRSMESIGHVRRSRPGNLSR